MGRPFDHHRAHREHGEDGRNDSAPSPPPRCPLWLVQIPATKEPNAAEPHPNEGRFLTTDCSDYPDGDWFIRAIRVIRGGWIAGELPSSSQAARIVTRCSTGTTRTFPVCSLAQLSVPSVTSCEKDRTSATMASAVSFTRSRPGGACTTRTGVRPAIRAHHSRAFTLGIRSHRVP